MSKFCILFVACIPYFKDLRFSCTQAHFSSCQSSQITSIKTIRAKLEWAKQLLETTQPDLKVSYYYRSCKETSEFAEFLHQSSPVHNHHLRVPRRGVFSYPYHSTCRVLNFWLPTVECWKIQEFVCFTLKFACFPSKQTDFVLHSR